MNTDQTPTLQRYVNVLAAAVPEFGHDEQRAAVTLYRELAKGDPVGAAQLAGALGVPTVEAERLLVRDPIRALVYSDEGGRVLGFGGLATAPMHHRFKVNGRALWTWCAWDTLFIPEILDATAKVESSDPETGEVVRLTVSPDRIEAAQPEDAVVSFLWPGPGGFKTSAANVMATFCHWVFFFASRESGERWVAKHEGTFLYSLEEAFALARWLNAKNFGSVLGRG